MSRDVYEHEPERVSDGTAAAPAQPREAVVIKPLPSPEHLTRDASAPREQSNAREDGRQTDRLREPVERYRLSPAEQQTLRDIGRFRAIHTADLERHGYGNNAGALASDLRHLRQVGLVKQHEVQNHGHSSNVVVLTPEGQRFVERDPQIGPNQRVYSGLAKRGEIAHDAAIYRMYQAEAADIRARGGTIRRVVLDYELKQKVYSPLAKARPRLKPEQYAERQAEVAAANGLEVVNGKIPLPDLRIEYETREGEIAKVDLELATSHYKASQVAEKASAGFVVYSEGGGSKPEDRELISEILSL